jgi:hypothetical protein
LNLSAEPLTIQPIEAPIREINVLMADDVASIIQKLEADIERCLGTLSKRLHVTPAAIGTHHLLTISGIDCSTACLQDLAVYCVGQIAKAVQINLKIRADLLGFENEDARNQLIQDVYSVIGENNDDLTDEQKRDERDPWLFEALSHLFVHLSTRNQSFFPVGKLIGLMPTHRSVKEQGLDLVAVYAGDNVGFGIGESKAWENDPSGGLQAAAKKFLEVDLGKYDADLRMTAGIMRHAMPVEYRNQMTSAFWKEERAYLPFIGYSSNHNPRWTSEREVLRSLSVPSTHRLLCPMPLEDFRDFFDRLASEMRTYLRSLEEL